MQADCPAYRSAAGQFRAVRLKAFWALARLLKQPPAQDARAIPFAGLKRRDLSQYYFQLQIRSRATAIDAPRAAAGLSESGRPHSRAPSTAMQRASALRPPPQNGPDAYVQVQCDKPHPVPFEPMDTFQPKTSRSAFRAFSSVDLPLARARSDAVQAAEKASKRGTIRHSRTDLLRSDY